MHLASNATLIYGLLVFFFLLSYSLINFPKSLFQKLNYSKERKYHEWRANEFKEKLEEIQYDLISNLNILRVTIDNLKGTNQLKDDIFDNYKDEEIMVKKYNYDGNQNDKNQAKGIKSYLPLMIKKYEDFLEISSEFDIDMKKEKDDTKEPIKEIKDLIYINQMINKKMQEYLRMQCRIKICYRRWVVLNTLLYLDKIKDCGETEEKAKKRNSKEKLITKYNQKEILLKEGFVPLDHLSKFKIIYIINIKKIVLWIKFFVCVVLGIIILIFEILMVLGEETFHNILKRIENFLILHFFILIFLVFLIIMSIHTLNKIKISSYIYMYKRQTNSSSLLLFTSYLSKTLFAICLNYMQMITQLDSKKLSKFTAFFNIIQTKEEDVELNPYLKLCRYCPVFLIAFIILFLFNIPGRIANNAGCNIFDFESEERNEGIEEGHKFLMKINKQLNGKILEYYNMKTFDIR